MGCGVFVSKYVLFGFNGVVCLLSVLITTVSSVVLYKVGAIDEAATFPVLGILLGVTTFVISFLGCCGSIKESYCMVTTYSIAMLLMLLTFAIVTGMTFNNIRKTELNNKRNVFYNVWKHKERPDEKAIINSIQKYCECCGKYGPTDWSPAEIPTSCCETIGTKSCTVDFAYHTGCIAKIRESEQHVAYLFLTFSVVCLVGFLMGYNLRNHISSIEGYTQLYV